MNKEEPYESLSHRSVLACEWSHRLLCWHGRLAVRPRYYAAGAARRAGALDRPTCWSVGSSLRDQRATGCRLPDDNEAFAGWLHHSDGGRAGAWSGLGPVRLSYDVSEGHGRVDRIAELEKTPAPTMSERRCLQFIEQKIEESKEGLLI